MTSGLFPSEPAPKILSFLDEPFLKLVVIFCIPGITFACHKRRHSPPALTIRQMPSIRFPFERPQFRVIITAEQDSKSESFLRQPRQFRRRAIHRVIPTHCVPEKVFQAYPFRFHYPPLNEIEHVVSQLQNSVGLCFHLHLSTMLMFLHEEASC